MSLGVPAEYRNGLEGLLSQIIAPPASASFNLNELTGSLQRDYYTSLHCVPALYEIASSSPHAPLRKLAAIELRKRITAAWLNLDEAPKAIIRNGLAQCVLSEQEATVRQSISSVIVSVAKFDLPDGKWTQLLSLLQAWCIDASNVTNRETGYFIVHELFQDISEVAHSNLELLFQLLTRALVDPESSAVRVLGVQTLVLLAVDIDPDSDKAMIKKMRAQVSAMAAVTRDAIQRGNVDEAIACITAFSDMLFLDFGLLNKNASELLLMFMEIASAYNQVDDNVRRVALDFLCYAFDTWIELLVKKQMITPIIEQLMNIICEDEGTDGTEADEAEDADDVDGDTILFGSGNPSNNALRALSILSESLPSDSVFPIVSRAVLIAKDSPNVHMRKGALLALAVICAGCTEAFMPELDGIAHMFAAGLSDQLPLIRSTACRGISLIVEDLGSDLTDAYHSLLLPPLITLLRSSTSPLTIGRACSTLGSFIQNMESDDAQLYLNDVLTNLVMVIQRPNLPNIIKSSAVCAISSAADAGEDQFIPFFEGVMPLLVELVALPNEEEAELRAMGMDALATVAKAVGPTRFRPYLMVALNSAHQGIELSFSGLKQAAYVLYTSLATVFKHEFGEVLPQIMPLVRATLHIEDEDDDDMSDDEDEDEEAERLEDELANELEAAITLVGACAEHVSSVFGPHILEYLNLIVDLIEYDSMYVRYAVHETLLNTVAVLFKASSPAGWKAGLPVSYEVHPDVSMVINSAIPIIIKSWQEEEDSDVVDNLLENFDDCLAAVGPALIAGHVELVGELLMSHFNRTAMCQLIRDDDDDSNDVTHRVATLEPSEKEHTLIYRAGELLITVAKTLGDQFTPEITKSYLDAIAPRLVPNRPDMFSIVAALIEVLGARISPFTEPLLQVFGKGLQESIALSRTQSNCAYALGIIVEKSGVDISGHLEQILQLLLPLVQQRNSVTSQAAHNAIDNACASICRVVIRYPEQSKPLLTSTALLPTLLSALPLRAEFDETDVVMTYLSSLLVDAQSVAEYGSVVPQITAIMTSIMRDGKRQLLSAGTLSVAAEALDLVDVKVPDATCV
ncbi:ARM repeat-containing protein [Ramicandelaber brevisporus]|nr:ARM repeat-containing protein [Ramicandelaber brevisporus]